MDSGSSPGPAGSPGPRTPSLLERLDLALASRLATDVPPKIDGATGGDLSRAGKVAPEAVASAHRELLGLRGPKRWRWIAGVLRLRGFNVRDDDVRCLFARSTEETCRIQTGTQEHKLIVGLAEILDRICIEAEAGRLPTGVALVGLFETLVGKLARFHNNTLRQDVPWDAVMYLDYPDHGRIHEMLPQFGPDECYRDIPALFRPLHPVRRSFRVFWRFARIAPFPDFNTVMAYTAMTWYLLAHGYPAVMPEKGDRAVLQKLVAAIPPKRFVRFENRMLQELSETEGAAAGGDEDPGVAREG